MILLICPIFLIQFPQRSVIPILIRVHYTLDLPNRVPYTINMYRAILVCMKLDLYIISFAVLPITFSLQNLSYCICIVSYSYPYMCPCFAGMWVLLYYIVVSRLNFDVIPNLFALNSVITYLKMAISKVIPNTLLFRVKELFLPVNL